MDTKLIAAPENYDYAENPKKKRKRKRMLKKYAAAGSWPPNYEFNSHRKNSKICQHIKDKRWNEKI